MKILLAGGIFEYCPTTGDLCWAYKRSNRVKAGVPIRQPKSNLHYVQVRLDGVLLLAHRIIWENMVGPIPKGMEINHINGRKDDNRLCNLELVTHAHNMQHAKAIGLTPYCTRPERAMIGVSKTGEGLFFKNSVVARSAGFHNATECARGKRLSDKGYSWAYF